MDNQQKFPDFLRSFENLTSHFDEHFGELGANERGDSFLQLAQKIIPLTEEGESYSAPVPNEKKSHDLGVDLLTSVADDGKLLCAQSKFKVRGKDDIDSVVSKFHNFERSLQPFPMQEELFVIPGNEKPQALVPVFCVITSSKLEGILGRYFDYEELKLLVLGIFSRNPNNLFEANYAELRGDLLEELYSHDRGGEKVFSVLLLMLKEGRYALDRCADTFSGEEYAALFKRFFEENRPRYRVYLTIVAMCAWQRKDLSGRSAETVPELERTSAFLNDAKKVLENSPSQFHDVFLLAFQAVADSILDTPAGQTENEIAQGMYRKISSMAFSSLYKKVLMRIDAERRLH